MENSAAAVVKYSSFSSAAKNFKTQGSSSTDFFDMEYNRAPEEKKQRVEGIFIPPPLPLLPQKQSVGDPLISTGLNMYFKKIEPFS